MTKFLLGVWIALCVTFSILSPETTAHVSPFASLFGLPMCMIGSVVIFALGGLNAITEWERVPVYLFGRYKNTVGPGLVWVDPIFHQCGDSKSINDTVWNLEVQTAQTKDNVPIALQFVLTWKIEEDRFKDFITKVTKGGEALQKRAIASVTELAASWELDNLLHNRTQFSADVLAKLQPRVLDWGITIKAIELKEFSIQHDGIANALAMKAKAQREGEAEVVRAELQLKVAKALEVAAKLYQNPDARWLRGLETLAELARSGNNNTILIPTELASLLGNIGTRTLEVKPTETLSTLETAIPA